MSRYLLLALPGLAAAAVAVALLAAGGQRSVMGALVRGGPTEGVQHLSCFVQVLRDTGDRSLPVTDTPLTIEAKLQDGRRHRIAAMTDRDGLYALNLELDAPAHGPVELELHAGSQHAPLAAGSVSLTPARWARDAGRRGGWLRGTERGELKLAVGIRQGVLAVPFAADLLIRVTRAGDPIAGATLTLQPDALAIRGAHRDQPAEGITNDEGWFSFSVKPRAHVVELVVAAAAEGHRGRWQGSLPVARGALAVDVRGSQVTVTSPISRSRAYLALVNSRERLGGQIVELRPTPAGGARGTVSIAANLTGARNWFVASSEADFAAMGLVGWPVVGNMPPSEPGVTFDVRDQLWLDGLEQARIRRVAGQQRARQWAALAAISAALLTLGLLWRRRRASDEELGRLEQALGQTGTLRPAAGTTPAFVIALLCVALGFVAFALWVLLKP